MKKVTRDLQTLNTHYLLCILFFPAHFLLRTFWHLFLHSICHTLLLTFILLVFPNLSSVLQALHCSLTCIKCLVLKYKGLGGLGFFASHLSPLDSWKSQLQELYHGKMPGQNVWHTKSELQQWNQKIFRCNHLLAVTKNITLKLLFRMHSLWIHQRTFVLLMNIFKPFSVFIGNLIQKGLCFGCVNQNLVLWVFFSGSVPLPFIF